MSIINTLLQKIYVSFNANNTDWPPAWLRRMTIQNKLNNINKICKLLIYLFCQYV